MTQFLNDVGVPPHIKGYHYLRDAIMITVKDQDKLDDIAKTLYPEIAKKQKTTSSRVERAIRHAIEIAWTTGHIKTIEKTFGYTINAYTDNPTNSEFIALIAKKK